jgi:hypothetical protein
VLSQEAERGLSPSSLGGMLQSLEWWFPSQGILAPEAMSFARLVLDALKRTGRHARQSKAKVVSAEDLLRLMEAPPAIGYWIFAAIVLLRHLGLPTRQFLPIERNQAVFDDGRVVLELEGASVVITHAGCFVDCPACALRLLVDRADDGPILSGSDLKWLREVVRKTTGVCEPRDVPDELLPGLIDAKALRFRVNRRDRAGIALSYEALLDRHELLALRWEDLSEEGCEIVARASGGTRRLTPRSDDLDVFDALRKLAEVWPWRGAGLWGCRGPIMAIFHPDHRTKDPAPLSYMTWFEQLGRRGQRMGIGVTPNTLRVSGALHDWHDHHDIVRLTRRLANKRVTSTEDFLRRFGVYRLSPTKDCD